MTREKMKILIVEDQKINREILKQILSKEYDTVEANNGQAALEVLEMDGNNISAVLLDIVMPVMNGYEFLENIQKSKYSNMPIIAMTGETDSTSELFALDKGAWDFVPKPYQPKVLLSRLKNAIARSQMFLLERMKYIAEHDTLTGLYNRTMTFVSIKKMFEKFPETLYAFIRFDIDRFRLLNTLWGEKECDRLLCYLADAISELMVDEQCVYGRMNADIFCFCEPYDLDKIEKQVEVICNKLNVFNENFIVEPSFGVYVITDLKMPVEQIYTRAHLAANNCKKIYRKSICFYEDEMERNIVLENEIIGEMQHALEDEQFVVYIQPKTNLEDYTTYGGEALVRWNHPVKGLISPSVFIPVFEKNGFIGKLDYYMWEKVCMLLRKWIDEGKNPNPISVNISRVNLYNPNLVKVLCGLVKKYDIPVEMLQLELTESACMDNPEQMKMVIQELAENNFVILMDDFGSGYSSLNTLKDIEVDILKIDMQFLSATENAKRCEIILRNIVCMAKQLDMPVIVEGVETKEQAKFLRDIGCEYVQGYYFAKPMDIEGYEKYVGIKNH